MNTELIALIDQLESIKTREAQIKKEKLLIEGQITQIMGNDLMEGSKSQANEDWTVTVTNGVTRACDWDKLADLSAQLPKDIQLITMKPSLNIKDLRVAERIAGAQFAAKLADAITIKPKKTAVSFKRKVKNV